MTSSPEFHIGTKHFIVCGDNQNSYCGRDFIEVIPETVGQYTGLKVKNDKEIYEGDILAKAPDGQSRYIVYFNKSRLSFTSRFEVLDIDDEGKEYWRVRYDDHSIAGALTYDNKVIGNIHSNPELLNQ